MNAQDLIALADKYDYMSMDPVGLARFAAIDHWASRASKALRACAAMAADAERYKWLRDEKNTDAVSGMIEIYEYGEVACLPDGLDLDNKIDAARKGETK